MLAGHRLLRHVLSIPLLVVLPSGNWSGGIILGCVNGLGIKFLVRTLSPSALPRKAATSETLRRDQIPDRQSGHVCQQHCLESLS